MYYEKKMLWKKKYYGKIRAIELYRFYSKKLKNKRKTISIK